MFKYNLKLALKSLRYRTGLTSLMVATIGIGIGMLMTMVTIGYQAERVPLPGLSDKLYSVQMDSREPDAQEVTDPNRMVNLTYRDAINLFNAKTIASQQTFNFKVFPILAAQDENTRPIQGMVDATTASFFSIFNAPFLYGKAWEKSENGAPVIVITKKTNDALFAGQNSVGKQLTVGTAKATVIGVLDDWPIRKRVFDNSHSSSRFDDAFMPYQFALDANLQRSQRMRCHPQDNPQRRAFASTDLQGLLTSECTWVNFWAKIDNPADVDSYLQFANQYATEQKSFGRFPRPILNFVTNIDTQYALAEFRNGRRAMLNLLAYLFFFVCLVNAVGMLLTKFLSTAKEVCLRRALGAKKKIIMMQYLMEVLMIGLMGGLLGVVVSKAGLTLMKHVRMYASDYNHDMAVLDFAYQLDWSMVSIAILVSIGSTIIVGLYPVWRIVNVSPASQLKGL
jgi:putative ABC transport system permease protein